MEDSTWKSLTDPVLLVAFSYLDVRELNIASRTCKNWYRVAQDESLWKCLTFRRLGCRYSRPNTLDWKSELKRLMYHVPALLHQTCQGDWDERFLDVCFSNSGQLIATCGIDDNSDGIVNIWRYGHETTLIHSEEITDNPNYPDYVEFNKAETHLLVHCVVQEGDYFDIVAILSIEQGTIQIVTARNCGIPQFRCTWLTNNTFLNMGSTDFTYRGREDMEFSACKLVDEVLDENESLSTRLLVDDFLSKENLDDKVVLQIERNRLVRMEPRRIQWTSKTSTSTNEMVLALYLVDTSLGEQNKIVFYKINLDSPDQVKSQPIKTIKINYHCLGVQLSADHRCLVYNLRRLCTDNIRHEKEVVTMVINLAKIEEEPDIFEYNKKIEEEPDIFEDNKVQENSSTQPFFFPSVSADLVANLSDPDIVHLWDCHSHQIISKLSHHWLPNVPKQSGVRAIAFHPRDQEVIVVAEDHKLRIWMSTNRHKQS